MLYGADGQEYRRRIGFLGGMRIESRKPQSRTQVELVSWKEVECEEYEPLEEGKLNADHNNDAA